MTGSCPTVRFTVDGRTVFTTDATKYDGGSCGKLRAGRDVEIAGWLMSDGTVRADEIDFDDDDDEDEDDE